MTRKALQMISFNHEQDPSLQHKQLFLGSESKLDERGCNNFHAKLEKGRSCANAIS